METTAIILVRWYLRLFTLLQRVVEDVGVLRHPSGHVLFKWENKRLFVECWWLPDFKNILEPRIRHIAPFLRSSVGQESFPSDVHGRVYVAGDQLGMMLEGSAASPFSFGLGKVARCIDDGLTRAQLMLDQLVRFLIDPGPIDGIEFVIIDSNAKEPILCLVYIHFGVAKTIR